MDLSLIAVAGLLALILAIGFGAWFAVSVARKNKG